MISFLESITTNEVICKIDELLLSFCTSAAAATVVVAGSVVVASTRVVARWCQHY